MLFILSNFGGCHKAGLNISCHTLNNNSSWKDLDTFMGTCLAFNDAGMLTTFRFGKTLSWESSCVPLSFRGHAAYAHGGLVLALGLLMCHVI